jgi:hypothetical protein
MTAPSSHSTPYQPAQEYPNPSEQAVQQNPIPYAPMGRASYASQAAPPPSYVPHQQGAQRPIRSIITINNLSLFSIVLSLILFGAFTFLGGILTGLALGGTKEPSPMAISQPYTVAPPGASQPQGSSYPPQPGMRGLAETAAAGVVSAISPSYVPQSFEPLEREAQGLAIQRATTAAEKAAGPTVVPASQMPAGSPHSLVAPVAPIASEPGKYAVRLGTFAAQENAKDLQNRLQALNYRTYLEKEESSQDTVYHVHSGKYETYATAAHAAQQFTKKSIPGTTVVKLPSDDTSGS